MSNLFTEQIKEREQLDASMKQKADSRIDGVITKRLLGDSLFKVHTNSEALEIILSKCGLTKENLVDISRQNVLFTRIENEKYWYRSQMGYCLGIDNEGNYTALIPGTIFGYYYRDNNAKKHRINEKNVKIFTEVYNLCCILPDKKMTIFSLFLFLMSFMRQKALLLYIFMVLISGVLGLVFPIMVNKITDLIERTSYSLSFAVLHTASVCIGMEITRFILGVMTNIIKSTYTDKVTYNVKNAVLYKYLGSDDETITKTNTSTLWGAITENIPDFLEYLLINGLSVIPNIVFILAYCGAVIYYLQFSSLFVFAGFLLLILIMWIIHCCEDKWYVKTLNNRIRGDHFLYNAYKWIEKIRSRRAQKRIYYLWSELYTDEAGTDICRKRYLALQEAIQDFLSPIINVILIIIVALYSMSYTTFVTTILLTGLLAPQICELTLSAQKIFNSKSIWQNISYLFQGGKERENKTICTEFTGDLTVQNLSYAYPGSEKIIDNLSFDVHFGDYIGISGISGCGKSTLLKLLLGILKPEKGEIRYGKYVLGSTENRSLLKNMGIVLQDETLIPGSIRQNMSMQPRPVTDKEIWDVLEKVGIDDLIKSYPKGLDTEIGVSGAELSGGQMQKLLIARALISKPKLLIFDEATSALDNVSQREIKDLLDSMKCTRIVVAHRLSTIKDCDRILLLENGKITQQGTYDELIMQDGQFKELVQCQNAL